MNDSVNVDLIEGCTTTLDAAEGAPEEVLLSKAGKDGPAGGDGCGMEIESLHYEFDRESKRARLEER